MNTRKPALHNNPQRGYSLAEVMVAMAVFTAIVLAALMIYDRSNRVFNQGVQASDLQQSTRVAFDKLVGDVRLAGFDYDRDGIPFGANAAAWTANTAYVAGNLVQPVPANGYVYLCTQGGTSGASQPSWPTTSKNDSVVDGGTLTWARQDPVQYQQPDEQIEYAGATAITIRANFDYETETGPCVTSGTPIPCENGREKALESSQFPVVTTGNDEIVTYALVSTTAAANNKSIFFYADIDSPRDANYSTKKDEKKVTISGIDTTNNNPPYTLYRFTLDKDGNAVPTPIADNIRSMTFQYFTDNAGSIALATPYPEGDGQVLGTPPNAATTDTLRDARASIKSIRVNLVGMNPNQDAAYTDADTVAPHYRKYNLSSLVVPRNIGKHGMKEFSTTAPGSPTIKTVCSGACNAVYVTWQAAVTGGDVDSYNILYDLGGCAGNASYAIAEDAGTNTSGYATKITPGQKYRFAVQAINKYGSTTSSNCIEVTLVQNTTKPADPTALDASGPYSATYPAIATGVQLYWPPVTTFNSSLNTTDCADGTSKVEPSIPSGENIRYRIWRNKNNFTVDPNDTSTWNSGGTKLVLSESSATQPTMSGTKLTWTDTTLPMGSCIDYYYRIQAVAYPCCGSDAMNKSGTKATAGSAVFPDSSTTAVKGRSVTTAKPEKPSGLGVSNLNCTGAVCDVKVTWNKVVTDTTGAFMFIDSYKVRLYQKDAMGNWSVVDSNTTYNGSSTTTFYNLNTSNFYRITVQALDCVTGDESDPVLWPCDWNGGNISISVPTNYGGSGSNFNPWIIQYPSNFLVQTQSNIQKVDVAVYNGQTLIGTGPQTINGPASSFNFALPQTPDGITCKVHVTMTALAPSTCVINQDYYVRDEAAPGCALKDYNTDPTVLSWTSGNNYVDVILKNNSTDQLTPLKAWVKWDNSNQGPAKFSTGISSIKFDNSGTATEGMTATCASANAVADVSAKNPGKINASQTNYVMRVTFAMSSGKNLSGNPISSVCIQYRTPFGDVKTCSVAPNAGNCTIPASTCSN